MRFYHVIKGRHTELKSANIKVPTNQWHTLGLKAEGERFTVTFNEKMLFAVNNRAIPDARQGRALDQGGQRHAVRPDRNQDAVTAGQQPLKLSGARCKPGEPG